MRTIILAGGRGTRLYPYTTVLPKPLMPVGDVPVIDIILRQLSNSGFKKVTLAVGYLANLIKAYVGDGKKWGVKVDYSLEERPLGTIGPLSRIRGLDGTFLVMNGDLLTDMDFRKILQYHRKTRGIATVAVKRRNIRIDYGVIEFDKKKRILSHREKPSLKYHVGIGICIFEPEVLKYIKPHRRFDFPDLVELFVEKGIPINVFETDSYWRDIGRWEDYLAAQRDYPRLKKRLFRQRG